jgi:hypothetical protein
MSDLNQTAENDSVHLQEWRVWAEINYLDSATEYREYLSNSPVQNVASRSDFVLLSTPEPSSKGRSRIFPVITRLVIALIAGYSLYAVVELLQNL